MQLIEGIKLENTQPKKSAAMYYKTEPFVHGIRSYHHTNNWEILKACEIIASKGYSIDLIDRSNKNWIPKKEYDLFLGLGVGNSGDQFVKYAKASRAKKRVLLAMGPQPDISNKLVIQRYEMFNKRTGLNAPAMRTVEKVIGDNFNEIINHTDYIFCIGEKGNESYNSFLKYDKPVLSFYPAISDKVLFDESWVKTRKRNHYLCFAGNGLICKGVDLVVEAFKEIDNATLHICGPIEKSFAEEYGEYINKSKNIFYHGFVEPGGSLFNDLVSLCSYTIFYSSSEGCCTSVATTMKAGLVPVVNSWTGINIVHNINGYLMKDENAIKTIQKAIAETSSIELEDYRLLVQSNNKRSKMFSQEGFITSYTQCIEEALK